MAQPAHRPEVLEREATANLGNNHAAMKSVTSSSVGVKSSKDGRRRQLLLRVDWILV